MNTSSLSNQLLSNKIVNFVTSYIRSNSASRCKKKKSITKYSNKVDIFTTLCGLFGVYLHHTIIKHRVFINKLLKNVELLKSNKKIYKNERKKNYFIFYDAIYNVHLKRLDSVSEIGFSIRLY